MVPPPQTHTHAHINEYPQHADAYSATQMCTWPNISFLQRKSTKTKRENGKWRNLSLQYVQKRNTDAQSKTGSKL